MIPLLCTLVFTRNPENFHRPGEGIVRCHPGAIEGQDSRGLKEQSGNALLHLRR